MVDDAIHLPKNYPVPTAAIEGLRQDLQRILEKGPLDATDLYVIEKLAVTGRELVFASDPKARLRGRSSFQSQTSGPLIFSFNNGDSESNGGSTESAASGAAASSASAGYSPTGYSPNEDEPVNELALAGALAPSTSAETFGTRALRELVATFTQRDGDPMVGLLAARSEAREMGLSQVVAAITAKIRSLEAERAESAAAETIAAAASGDVAEDPAATLSVVSENGSVEAEPETAPQTPSLNDASVMTVVNVTNGPAQEE